MSKPARGEKQLISRLNKRAQIAAQQKREDIATVDRLRDLEDTISRGLETYREVGNALVEIKEQKLWKPHYPSFASYIEDRWKWTVRYANNIIRAAKTADALGSSPKNEAIAREFAKLAEDDPEKARLIFDALSSNNPDHSAREARAFIRDPRPALPPLPQDDYTRRTKSYIENMLAKFDANDLRGRQSFLLRLYQDVQSKYFKVMGARPRATKNIGFEELQAAVAGGNVLTETEEPQAIQ